jgi:hypothetical protein
MSTVNIKITKLPKSEIEIEGEIETTVFESYYKKALQNLGENLEIDGFRKGKVPENIMISKIPEISILEEMAELALGEHYPKMIEEHKLDVIDRPEIAITKLGRNNPLGFKIKTATIPEVTLPDYKKIAKDINSSITAEEKNITVTDEELENTIKDIQKSRAPKKHITEGVELSEEEKNKEPELPELTDEFVQSMGPFTDAIAWNTENMIGARRFLERLWRLGGKITATTPSATEVELHKTIKKVTSDIQEFKFNTAIAQMMILLNTAEKEGIALPEYRTFIQLVAPFAPHITEELWHEHGGHGSVHTSVWPTHDEAKLISDTVTIAVQVLGKLRATIQVTRAATEEEVKAAAREAAHKWTKGRPFQRRFTCQERL